MFRNNILRYTGWGDEKKVRGGGEEFKKTR